jgi:hypothetical protein
MKKKEEEENRKKEWRGRRKDSFIGCSKRKL